MRRFHICTEHTLGNAQCAINQGVSWRCLRRSWENPPRFHQFFFKEGGTPCFGERERQIRELERLDREATEKIRRQQEEIGAKQQRIRELDNRLKKLRNKTGITGDENNLDAFLEILKEKKRKAQELEKQRKRVEAELREKEKEFEEARKKQIEEREQRFNSDYSKYKQIEADSFSTEEFKAEAWRVFCSNWGLSKETPIGDVLVFTREGSVTSEKALEINSRNEFKNEFKNELKIVLNIREEDLTSEILMGKLQKLPLPQNLWVDLSGGAA